MIDFKIRNFNRVGISLVLGSNAMVVSSHPLVSSIGIEILKNNDNTVDAAIAYECSSICC